MDKRPETRVATEILVRVWGMDADGRPFFQNANASNLSSEGARISGISHPLKLGMSSACSTAKRKPGSKYVGDRWRRGQADRSRRTDSSQPAEPLAGPDQDG